MGVRPEIWALHHEHISLHVERPEKWFLHVATRCCKLGQDGRCTIYGRHPVLCREYDPRECERRLPLADVRATFHDGESLEAWLARERPRHHARLMAHRKDFIPAPQPGATNGAKRAAGRNHGRVPSKANAAQALVQIAGLARGVTPKR